CARQDYYGSRDFDYW
nr:immunoglobulin heavy chain junction region [Mus musculus]MBK4196464.1 immunoglobulin heavy chain junction region [Mus musculus]